MKITASIVIYNDEPRIFERAISSFLKESIGEIFIIDNSDYNIQSDYFNHTRVKYIKTYKNLGFGRGHNLALNKINFNSDLHFFINPDVYFNGVINEIISVFEKNLDFGVLMPKILYPDGSIQNLCKLLPKPSDLILRRFINLPFAKNISKSTYVLEDLDDNKFSEIPSLSGCFLAARTNILKDIGGFDERYFLYMEDIDLVRRIGKKFKTIFYPKLEVFHEYKKGSYISKKLLLLHIKSAIAYFNKYGWFFDNYRSLKNNETLSKLTKK